MNAQLVRSRRRLGPGLERLEGRRLLASLTLSAPGGPITALTLGDDGSFQVQHTGFQSGQVYPADTAPGDAGIFLRLADGTVDGLDVPGRENTTAAGSTNSIGLNPISFVEAADGQSVTLVADNRHDQNPAGSRFQLTQVTTFHPGDAFFRVDATIQNPGAAPLSLDVFAAADIFLGDDDLGVGFHDAATGAVGGTDASGQYHIFVQPNPGGGLTPSSYQEDIFDNIWSTIGSGAHFDNTILPPTGSPPYSNDPNYVDNGAGLEWKGVTIAPGGSAQISYFWSFGPATSVATDPALTAGPAGLDAVAGAPFTGTVASFQDADPSARMGDYAPVTIDWGDGQSSGGTVAPDPAGGFAIQGSHTYAREGSYPLRVAIQDNGGASALAVGEARVADAPLSAIGQAIDPVAGSPYNGILATFDDADPSGTAADLRATIDWGDGSTPGPGTIRTRDGGGFAVEGTHTYAKEGTYRAVVTIDDVGGASTTAEAAVTVDDAPLSIKGTMSPNPTATLPFTATLLTFQDGDPNGQVGDFGATIDWGDGTPTEAGAIVPNPGGGFDVNGSHTYAKGLYTITINVRDRGGATAQATVPVSVPDRPLNLTGVQIDLTSTAAGAAAGGFVAYFYDADPTSRPSDYRATIDWGDGTPPTSGTITPIPDGGPGAFTVDGQHTYPAGAGQYRVITTVDQPFGPSAGAISMVTVTASDSGTNPTLTPSGPVANPPVSTTPLVLNGMLDPASDSGPSHDDGITNDPRPRFLGTGTPGLILTLTASRFEPTPGQPFTPALGALPIGQATVGPDGSWSLTPAEPLPDGAYVIIAQAFAPDDRSIGAQIRDADHPLVIDTVGPKVDALTVDAPSGRIGVTYRDDRSGLDLGSVLDLSNYNLTKVPLPAGQHFAVTGAALAPTLAAVGPADPLPVVLTTDNGQRLHHGRRYVLSIAAGGVQDMAGNALDGEFAGKFPTGDGRPGGAFHVRILTDGRQVFPLRTYQGPDPLALRVRSQPPGRASQALATDARRVAAESSSAGRSPRASRPFGVRPTAVNRHR